MDMYTFALSIAYTNKAIKAAELEGFKVQVETTRDILETVGEEKTFYFLPKAVSEPQNGYDEYIYVNDSWELMGSTDIDLSGYMALAPLNPTAQEIEAMPSGQLYGDTVNHKGVIKGRQEFYDKDYIDSTINHAYKSALMPPYQSIAAYGGSGILKVGDLWECTRNPRTQTFVLSDISTDDNWTYILNWEKLCPGVNRGMEQPITQETISRADYRNANIGIEYAFPRPTYLEGQIYLVDYNGGIDTIFVCARESTSVSGNNTMTAYYRWGSCYSQYLVYTKDEVNTMIGDIETALSEV